MTRVLRTVTVAAGAILGACSGHDAVTEDRVPREDGSAPVSSPPAFVDRVWIVAESEQIATGEIRVFLSEGTLVLASPHATPAFGSWSYVDGRLTIVEEGVEYAADILELTGDAFRIRIHSPGEPVEIRFAAADVAPCPVR